MAKPNINNSRESIRWYVRVLKQLDTKQIRKEGLGEYVPRPQLGKLCCYYYDPKTKEKLPHWDKFPLVMPLDYQDMGDKGTYVLGLNLHYLPPDARTVLFDQLFAVRARKDLTKENQIMMSYMVLKRTSQFPGWKDCIKRYIPEYFRSRVLEIDPLSWKLAVALPTQQFVKKASLVMAIVNLFGVNVDAESNGSLSVKIPGLPGITLNSGGSSVNPNFNIQNFIQNLAQHNETARTNKFNVFMVPPANVAAYAKLSPAYVMKGLSLQCESSQLPGRDIQMTEYTTHAFVRRVPHMNQFGLASFTFICTGDMWEKKFFDSWIDFMIPVHTGLINYPLDANNNRNYEADIFCNQYDSTGNLIYVTHLYDATPVSISALDQNWENESIHKLQVSFQFRKWLSDSTTYKKTTTFSAGNPGVLPSDSTGTVSTAPTAPSTPTDQRIAAIVSNPLNNSN